jgi:hypothetical protein
LDAYSLGDLIRAAHRRPVYLVRRLLNGRQSWRPILSVPF